MGAKGHIADYRSRLDKTLASHGLTNEETIHDLVKDQILRTSHSKEDYIANVVERRSKEVSNFLEMLRSSSSVDNVEGSRSSDKPHGGWNVKQDTEEFRVMYREGPEGTPLHTLLVEGYVDGPMDVCLCISCEAGLYQKWWPETTIPSFKVISSQCLQRVRTGEQISLVRMKVSWPLSSREALVHYFTFEYFQDDLVIVLLNSISDLEAIDPSTHGFKREGIPDARDVVRIDLVGGFALQKVTENRSFFRTIANMDIKLDFVPPAFINFISRQLVGSGFKLYKKEVASVTKGDQQFTDALKDPLYTRIREALYSENVEVQYPEKNLENGEFIMVEEQIEATESNHTKENIDGDYVSTDSESEDVIGKGQKALCEIEEIEETNSKESDSLEKSANKLYHHSPNMTTHEFHADKKKKVVIRAEVEQALGTLEQAISIFRAYLSNTGAEAQLVVKDDKIANSDKDGAKESIFSVHEQIYEQEQNINELSKRGSMELSSHEPRNSSGSHGSRSGTSKEVNHSKIAPSSPDCWVPGETNEVASYPSKKQTKSETMLEKTEDSKVNIIANVIPETIATKQKKKKSRYCCLHFISGQAVE